MLLALLLLFIAIPIVEIYVIIQVGQAIGALWTIALLIADSILGSMLMRSQGRAVWRRFNRALSEGRPPGREVLDGALVILGGTLLLTPGFVTDVFGLTLLLPPTRAIVRRLLARRMALRVVGRPMSFGARTEAGRSSDAHADDPAGFDVEGTASETGDLPRLPHPPEHR